MNKRFPVLFTLLLLLVSGCGGGEDSPALEGSPEAVGTGEASVRFRSPEDGATVDNPVRVQMEAEGVTIEPASSGVNANAGHFHVLVDVDCFPEGEVIPNDQSHHHYGMGQTEAQLTLAPGEHQLCLQVGDGNHAALPLTDTVEITVR